VTLLEAQEKIDDSPRASTTQPPTLEILAELASSTSTSRRASSRARSSSGPADAPADREFDFSRLRDETAYPLVVQTEQHKLAKMAIERLRCMPNAEVLLGCAVSGISQDEKQVMVTGEGISLPTTSSPRTATQHGAQAARDRVRGYTWPESFSSSPPSSISGRARLLLAYYMAIRTNGPTSSGGGRRSQGSWRAVFNTRPDESDERLVRRFSPCPPCALLRQNADWLHLNLYSVHQRVAKNFRKGRVFLCGDAAHVNNPIGGPAQLRHPRGLDLANLLAAMNRSWMRMNEDEGL